MHNMFYISSLLLFIFSCNQPKEQNSTNVGNSKSNTISIIFQNIPNDFQQIGEKKIKVKNAISYSDIDYPFTTDIIANIKASKVYSIKNVNRLVLNYSNIHQQFIFFAKANDTLFIDFQKDDTPVAKILNRPYVDHQLNYDSQKDLHYPANDIVFFAKKSRFRNTEEQALYLAHTLKQFSLEIAQLDSLYESEKNVAYLLRKKLCIYKKKTFTLNHQEALATHQIPFSTIELTEKGHEELLAFPSYVWFLESYIRKKYNIELLKNSQGAVSNFKKAFDATIQDDYLTSKVKDYLLLHYLDKIAENFSKNDAQVFYQKLHQRMGNHKRLNAIKAKYLLKATSKSTAVLTLLNKEKAQTSLSTILSQYKGQVVYVDFWASWCLPCKTAIPYSKKLQTNYKDVVFLYISIDKNFEQWIKSMDQEQLPNSYSFLATNYPEATLYQELKLKSIPRYLLFDKDGHLVNENAPPPNSNEIRNQLEKYL